MLVTFSPTIPSEAASNDEMFSPFKTFIIDNSPHIITKKFEKHKGNRKIDYPVPECYICGMYPNSFSQFKIKEEMWICSFCNKENLHGNLAQLNKKLKTQKYYIKTDILETPNDLLESLLPPLKNLIIMVVDFGNLMENLKFSTPSDKFDLKEWLSFLIERDLPKYPPNAKFLLLLCNYELTILNNDSENKEPIFFEYPYYDDPISCFNWGKNKAYDFLIGETNNAKYLLEKIRKKKYETLSSIGAGFALALGIIHTVKPADPRIVLIGQGSVSFGACRNVNFENNREKECKQELKQLYDLFRKAHEINIQVIDVDDTTERNNFFTHLSEVFPKTEIFNEKKRDKLRNFDILPIDESEINECTLRIASSPNIFILPYDTLTHDKATYCFQEKRGVWIMRKVDPIRCLYPFHFEFKAGKSAVTETEVLLQVELRVKMENSINVYVTTKRLQILKNKKFLDYSFLNFTVSNYCYYANDFFFDEKKVQGLQKLVNEYLTALKGKYPTPPLILSMRKYIEEKYNCKFDIQTPIKDTKELLLTKFLKNNNDGAIIDFKKIERLSEKKK